MNGLALPPWVSTLTGVDLAMLVWLALSMLFGLWRGLVFEVLSLMGWLLAWVLAQAYSAQVAGHLPVGAPGSAINHSAGFALTFVVTLMACGLAARLARMMVAATPLNGLDRLLGGCFGLLRGIIVLLVAATLVALTPAARSVAWQSSRGAAWLSEILHGLRPAMPDDLVRRLWT